MESTILELHDAVESDDGSGIAKILSESRIPVKIITGLLVIAVENKLINAGRAILNYNTFSHEKISDLHLNAIICLAAKTDVLDQLKITYH
jgi:hypothetical protein